MSLIELSLLAVFAAPPDALDGHERGSARLATITDLRTSDYDALKRDILDASRALKESLEPERVAELERLLACMADFVTQLSNDEYGRELVRKARLNLLRAYHQRGDPRTQQYAEDIVRTIPVLIKKNFGAAISELLDDARSRMAGAGSATIKIACRTGCDVAIDTYPERNRSIEVYLGPHTIWLEARDGSAPPEQFLFNITVAGEVETIEYPSPTASAEVPPAGLEINVFAEPESRLARPEPTPEPTPEPDVLPMAPSLDNPVARDRILPRAVELGGVGLGVGLGAVGAAMWGYAGGCGSRSCPPPIVGGVSLVGVAGVLLVTSLTTLAIDEARARNKTKMRKKRKRRARFEGGRLRF